MRSTTRSARGSPESICRSLEVIVEATGADELMVTSQIYDHRARLRSYEILADAVGLAGPRA